jgi:hypothetical protein
MSAPSWPALLARVRSGVVDVTPFKNLVGGVDHAKNTVSLMVEVDSNIDGTVVGWCWFGHKTAHPTTFILPHSRARFVRKHLWNQAFMSADLVTEWCVRYARVQGCRLWRRGRKKRYIG